MTRIASRRSKLALAQSRSVLQRLQTAWPDESFEIVEIDTRGDRLLDRPLPEIGGKGLFTEALEAALRSGAADLAVHSLKDLPTEMGEELVLGAIAEREDPRDVWITGADGPSGPEAAAPGAVVGTSSERRRALIRALRDDLEVASIRGNVDTRLRKLDEGQYDALIMAAAGLRRLDLGHRIAMYLDPPDWLPAPGQGAIAVQCRAGDSRVTQLLEPLEDAAARAETEAERSLLARLEGGCQVPVAALARAAGSLALHALVALPDGSRVVRAQGQSPMEGAAELGRRVADDLIGQGADSILDQVRKSEAGSR